MIILCYSLFHKMHPLNITHLLPEDDSRFDRSSILAMTPTSGSHFLSDRLVSTV